MSRSEQHGTQAPRRAQAPRGAIGEAADARRSERAFAEEALARYLMQQRDEDYGPRGRRGYYSLRRKQAVDTSRPEAVTVVLSHSDRASNSLCTRQGGG